MVAAATVCKGLDRALVDQERNLAAGIHRSVRQYLPQLARARVDEHKCLYADVLAADHARWVVVPAHIVFFGV